MMVNYNAGLSRNIALPWSMYLDFVFGSMKDPELKAFATHTLPTLKIHLAAIQKVKQQIK